MLKSLSPAARRLLGIVSFVLPVLVWCAVSYVPFIWHPLTLVTQVGDVDYQPGMRVDNATFSAEVAKAKSAGKPIPAQGIPPIRSIRRRQTRWRGPSRPPSPRPPHTRDGEWLNQVCGIGFRSSSGDFVICSADRGAAGRAMGTYGIARLSEPFIEFFRYLPAPAFGALAVAILGIYDAPKVTIIVIGTLFQQVLIIANTTRKLDVSLVEAALTLGTRNLQPAAPWCAARHLA